MSQNVEIVSNFQRKKIALKVRRDGPQPSIFVRSFRSFTINVGKSPQNCRFWKYVRAFSAQFAANNEHWIYKNGMWRFASRAACDLTISLSSPVTHMLSNGWLYKPVQGHA